VISTGGKLEGVEGFGAGDGLIRALLVCEKFGMGVWRILYIMRYAKAMSSSIELHISFLDLKARLLD